MEFGTAVPSERKQVTTCDSLLELAFTTQAPVPVSLKVAAEPLEGVTVIMPAVKVAFAQLPAAAVKSALLLEPTVDPKATVLPTAVNETVPQDSEIPSPTAAHAAGVPTDKVPTPVAKR